eukprot:scaffold2263_cov187-Ochromonas_danica.AAC.10
MLRIFKKRDDILVEIEGCQDVLFTRVLSRYMSTVNNHMTIDGEMQKWARTAGPARTVNRTANKDWYDQTEAVIIYKQQNQQHQVLQSLHHLLIHKAFFH